MNASLKFYFNKQYFDAPNTVYYPSEDSYFLAENISIKKNAKAIGIGCGTGIQSLNLLFKGASKVIAIDINKKALDATKKNCEQAGFGKKTKCVKSNLFENCKEKADIIVFNPPYVVAEELKFKELDGGKKGREILDKFLEQFPEHLEKNGKCFFIQTNINGYAETKNKLKKLGVKAEIIAKRSDFFEELAVFECKN